MTIDIDFVFFFSSRRRHTRCSRDWSSDVCSSDLDHEIVRRGLRALLEKHEGWEVCGEASDGRETVEKALQLKPDVVILDIGMPLLNGLDTTRQRSLGV